MSAQEEQTWNEVKRKRGRLRHIFTPEVKEGTLSTTGMTPNPSPQFSVGEVGEHHRSVSQDWYASSCWLALRDTLIAALSARKRPVVTRAICLGPGPYEPSNGSSSARRTAHMQTEAFRAVVNLLGSRQDGHAIDCIVQEPGFTQTDKHFCGELGLVVAETPAAFSMVDANTLVFGIHLELPTYHRALATLPAIFIGVGLESWENKVDFDPSIKDLIGPLAVMDATYDKYSFPDFNYMFSSTTIYWRREDGSWPRTVC
ncbi:hypothetical protein QBC46DRAFT_87427 [Diplogelasinospora grovesii]|uniref:SRR1-like domain-containing protein n=1 Tax=Diplogelasinospora grovesii TaxID=303347 RepID=A0AAN6NA47_9PEZI|nr:hypothetical protein QBC46DRAFT_87427 [Diplogelasinospora grovesii]